MQMRRLFLWLAMSLLIGVMFSAAPVAQAQDPEPQLRQVIVDVDSPDQVKKLVGMGLDIASVRRGADTVGPRGVTGSTFRIAAVVSNREAEKLNNEGFTVTNVPRQHTDPSQFDVYHSYDEPGRGVRAELRRLASNNRDLIQLRTIGRSLQNRPILAVRVTNERSGGNKPQVLLHSTTHAREWISTQMTLRLLNYLTSNYGTDPRVTQLLDTTEVWVIPVVNPDGYEYTFTNERLWRKNLRDNDGDGQITLADGVDLNRNYSEHWGLDDEGSSPDWPNNTYRGAAPESEPETQALVQFIQRNDFKFIVSYHSFGNLILYPWGWQVSSPSNDDAIFLAQAGTDANPAIFDSLLGIGYDPGVGADLYITNGEFTDWAYGEMGIPAYTVELTFGSDADGFSNFYGFEFPDDEAMVQTVFEDNLEFALSLAESAHDPANPVSPVGMPTQDVYHTPLTDSYGSDQIIEVIARNGLPVSLSYSINNGPVQAAAFSERVGEFYNEAAGVYYSRHEAVIGGQAAGDTVSYQVSGGSSNIAGNYTVTSASGNPILVVAAEDYSGPFPTYALNTEPNYLQYYTDALDAGGYAYDVWDIDAQGIPNYIEVLSHYETAIWYTGDDFAPVVPNGLITHRDEYLTFRDFINYEGGNLFATGQDLAWLSAVAAFITTDPNGATVVLSDDFFQYYLGANLDIDTGGIDTNTGLPSDIKGEPGDPIFDGLNFSLHNGNGGDGADNQCCSSTFLSTSSFLPHFPDLIAARYDRVGGPFDPHSGDFYVYSQLADLAHKRLGGTFNIPAGSPTLKFWVSYDIESDWDFAFVEVSEAGSGVWTTLPDLNGFTTTNTGQSCLSGWVDQIHNFLANYMDAACNPVGATGAWNAFTGNSGGWHQVEMDLSAYAGQTVELHISYATDWATQGLGVFVDDIELAGAPLEDFEAGLGQWQITAGPSGAFNNFAHITGAGFPEGPAMRTPFSVYLGFGFEAIDTAANRNVVMDRVMQYLGQ